MSRTPVTDDQGLPACYGLSHDSADRMCRDCPHAETCAGHTSYWKAQKSLSQMAHEAHERTRILAADPAGIYAELYRQHFGRVHRVRNRTQVEQIERTYRMCRALGIDFAVYVAAQMRGMEKGLDWGKGVTFQPQHLLGEKALRRYNVHVQMAKKRYANASYDTMMANRAEVGRVRRALRLSELDVGQTYVTQFLDGDDDWESCVDLACPAVIWHTVDAFDRGKRPPRNLPPVQVKRAMNTVKSLGEDRMRAELRAARLSAACAVANDYGAALADSISVRVFSWRDFALFLKARVGIVTTTDMVESSVLPVWVPGKPMMDEDAGA